MAARNPPPDPQTRAARASAEHPSPATRCWHDALWRARRGRGSAALRTLPLFALVVLAPAVAAAGAAPPSLGTTALRSVAALALVVALVLATSVVARRWLGRIPAGGHRHPIQIIASRGLPNRATLTVVEVEGERVLVGSSPHGLSLLYKLGAPGGEVGEGGRFDHVLASASAREAR